MNSIHLVRARIAILLIIALVLLPYQSYAVDAQGRFVLVIDPGHGGKDPGAVNGKNQEKSINLKTALKMGQLIEQNCKDVKVIYTRKTDVFVELYKRADIANKAGADMFISIHTNSAKNKQAHGAETFLLGVEDNRTNANLNVAIEENKAILFENDYETHYEGYDPNSPESMIIFEFMQNEHQKESLKMASYAQNQIVNGAKRLDRGVHQAGYLVLWKSAMPSILVELGFISNDNECKYLTSQKGIDELSLSLYKSFQEYYDYHKKVTENSSSVTLSSTINEEPASSTTPIYKIQFMTLQSPLKTNDKRINLFDHVSYYTEKGVYKYTCGDTTDYEEALKTKKEVQKKYKDAFIIAFYDDKKIDLQKAREISAKNK